MATIVTRAGKGSPLTHDEVDDNFDNLNTDKVETSAIGTAAAANTGDFATAAQGTLAASAVQPNDSPTFGTVTATSFAGDGSALTGLPAGYTDADVDTHLNTSTASNGEVLSWTGTDYDWIAAGGGGAALELYAENPSSPTAPSATGTNAVAIGSSSVASGYESFSAGFNCTATAYRALALGHGANAGNTSVALGTGANASGGEGNALGRDATASGSESAALGHSSVAVGTRSTALTRSYASGTDSFAAAIANNTSSYGATGANSIAIGSFAKANNTGSAAIGQSTAVYANYGTAIGYTSACYGQYGVAIGDSCSVVASNAVAIGDRAYTSGVGSFALGTQSRTYRSYQFAYSSGQFSSLGDAQTSMYVLRSDTTDATPEALTTDNSVAGTNDQIVLPNNSAYSFSGTIIAREQASAGSDYASWEIKGALLRDGSAATTVLGNGIQNKLFATAGASAWAIALTADTTNGGLKIEVTGAAATNIRWVATVNTSEVTY